MAPREGLRPREAGSAQGNDEMKKGRKTSVTIRIDDDILQWYRAQMHKASGGSYQTAMNGALRRAMESSQGHADEHSGPLLRNAASDSARSRFVALRR